MSQQFLTETGCTIRTASGWVLGMEGVVLELCMDQPGDGRRAEVRLTPTEVTALVVNLMHALDEVIA